MSKATTRYSPAPPSNGWKKWFWFLRSRKVHTAIATVVCAIAADWGYEADAGTVTAIISVGAGIILGIAIEDAGTKSRSSSATLIDVSSLRSVLQAIDLRRVLQAIDGKKKDGDD